MQNTARIVQLPVRNTPNYYSGTVQSKRDGHWEVNSDGHFATCKQAASCLLEPNVGDRVVVYTEAQESWIVAVLERVPTSPAELVVQGDTVIRAENGTMTLNASQGLRLESKEEVRVVSQRLRSVVDRLDFVAKTVLATGQSIKSDFQQAESHGSKWNLFVDNVTQHVRNAIKIVEEADVLRTKRLDYKAEGVASVQGSATVVTAKEVVKVDGTQIQLG